MKKAIGLRFVPYDEKKHLKSHFLGAPAAIPTMQDEFDDGVFFLGMIHLPEIAALDKENKLPHEGYLYFFLDSSGTTRRMTPIVRYVVKSAHRSSHLSFCCFHAKRAATLRQQIQYRQKSTT